MMEDNVAMVLTTRRIPIMGTSICFLLIALGVSGQSALGQSSHVSKKPAKTTACADLSHKVKELAALRASITKGRAAIAAVDLQQISVYYAQGLRMTNVIDAGKQDLSRADGAAAAAETLPSLLYYFDAYSDAIDAATGLHRVSFLFTGDFAPIAKNRENLDEASVTRIQKWQSDLDNAAYDITRAREEFGMSLRPASNLSIGVHSGLKLNSCWLTGAQ
jgi:hypothetical protein